MSNALAVEVKTQYEKAIATIKGIVEAFPEDRWLAEHGDEFYIPCRLAYHLAVIIDGQIAGGHRDPEFMSKIPYGPWGDTTAATLPDKKTFMTYFEGIIGRAQKELETLNDEFLMSPTDERRARLGATQIAVYLYMLRELSDHTGELNKMLIEDGKEDVWVR